MRGSRREVNPFPRILDFDISIFRELGFRCRDFGIHGRGFDIRRFRDFENPPVFCGAAISGFLVFVACGFADFRIARSRGPCGPDISKFRHFEEMRELLGA